MGAGRPRHRLRHRSPCLAGRNLPGQAELKEALRRTWDVYDEFRFEGDEFIDARDAVVALGAVHVRGALSGATAVQTGGAMVSRVRDGRIAAVRVYFARDQALEDAGLRE